MPFLFVVGAREAKDRSVAIRRLGTKDQETLALGDAVNRLKADAGMPSGG